MLRYSKINLTIILMSDYDPGKKYIEFPSANSTVRHLDSLISEGKFEKSYEFTDINGEVVNIDVLAGILREANSAEISPETAAELSELAKICTMEMAAAGTMDLSDFQLLLEWQSNLLKSGQRDELMELYEENYHPKPSAPKVEDIPVLKSHFNPAGIPVLRKPIRRPMKKLRNALMGLGLLGAGAAAFVVGGRANNNQGQDTPPVSAPANPGKATVAATARIEQPPKPTPAPETFEKPATEPVPVEPVKTTAPTESVPTPAPESRPATPAPTPEKQPTTGPKVQINLLSDTITKLYLKRAGWNIVEKTNDRLLVENSGIQGIIDLKKAKEEGSTSVTIQLQTQQ